MDRNAPQNVMDVLTWMRTGATRYLFTARVYPNDGIRVPTALRMYGYTPPPDAPVVTLPDFFNDPGYGKTPKGAS